MQCFSLRNFLSFEVLKYYYTVNKNVEIMQPPIIIYAQTKIYFIIYV